MKRILPLLLALCPLVPAAEPPMEPPPSQVLAEVKRATRCKIEYARSAVRPKVIIELPEARAAQVLALLAQMEPADGKMNGGVDIYFGPNAVFPTIIVTTPEGEELRINVMDIGYSDSTEPRYYRDLFKLPRLLLYRLEALVRPEANLDLINH